MKGMLFFVAVSQIVVLCTFCDYFGESEKMIPLLNVLSSFDDLLSQRTYPQVYDCSSTFLIATPTLLLQMGVYCWTQFVL